MESWIGVAVAKMHCNKITQIEVAEKLGVTNDWISLILLGKRKSKGIEQRIMNAIDEIKSEKDGTNI